MRHPSILAVLAVLLSGACINVPEVVQVPETPDAGEPDTPVEDSGIPDASVPDSGIPDSGTQDLAVELQSSRSITNGDVQLTVTVSGPAPDEVEMLVDGAVVATLTPPYELRWSTQSIEEGEHVLAARATLGGRGFTSGSRTLVVDRTPPRVVSQSPQTGARTVSVHQTVQAIFSEPLDVSTVSEDSVKLLSEAGIVASEVSLSLEGTSLTLRPVSSLPVDTTVTVSFENAVTDLAGNSMQPPEPAWEWTVPGYLPLGTPLSYSPDGDTSLIKHSLRIHAPGHPVVAWVSGGPAGEEYGVHVSRWNGSDWVQLGGVLDGNPGVTYPEDCSLQMDADGRLFVAWREGVDPSGANVHVRAWNDGAWEALGGVVSPLLPQGWISHFQFRVNRAGDKVVALSENGASGSQVSVWRWTGSAWNVLGGALKVNPTWSVSSMQVQLDGTGKAVVTWSEANISGDRASYMRRWNGNAWEEIPLPFPGLFPGLFVLDGSDSPVLARSEPEGGAGTALRPQIWRRDGSSWTVVGNPIGGIYPGMTNAGVGAWDVDSEGKLVAMVAEPEVSGGTENFYLRRWSGAMWESVGGLLKPSPGLTMVIGTTLAVDPSRQPLLARIEQTETEPHKQRIYVYRPND